MSRSTARPRRWRVCGTRFVSTAAVRVVHLPEAGVEILRVAVRPGFLRAAPAVGGVDGAAVALRVGPAGDVFTLPRLLALTSA